MVVLPRCHVEGDDDLGVEGVAVLRGEVGAGVHDQGVPARGDLALEPHPAVVVGAGVGDGRTVGVEQPEADAGGGPAARGVEHVGRAGAGHGRMLRPGPGRRGEPRREGQQGAVAARGSDEADPARKAVGRRQRQRHRGQPGDARDAREGEGRLAHRGEVGAQARRGGGRRGQHQHPVAEDLPQQRPGRGHDGAGAVRLGRGGAGGALEAAADVGTEVGRVGGRPLAVLADRLPPLEGAEGRAPLRDRTDRAIEPPDAPGGRPRPDRLRDLGRSEREQARVLHQVRLRGQVRGVGGQQHVADRDEQIRVARQPADGVEARGEREDAPGRHHAVGGPVSGEALVGRRDADRSPGVGGEADVGVPERDGAGRPRAGAAADPVRRPRVGRGAGVDVGARQAPGELVGAGDAGHVGARGQQRGDDGRVGGLGFGGGEPRGVAGTDAVAGDGHEVLDRDPAPGERTGGASPAPAGRRPRARRAGPGRVRDPRRGRRPPASRPRPAPSSWVCCPRPPRSGSVTATTRAWSSSIVRTWVATMRRAGAPPRTARNAAMASCPTSRPSASPRSVVGPGAKRRSSSATSSAISARS